MADAISVTGAFTRAEDKDATFETGLLAPLAGGAVTARMGDTVVLVTATCAKSPREGADFFPLTVDVEERMYAAGRIPGSFFRREARAGEQAILTCRLIDRPLRPSFPDGFRNEVHVVATVLGADQSHPYDIAALNAASLALSISPIPFDGPIGAVRVAWSSSGEWVPFPTYAEGEDSAFEMVVAGRLADDDVAVMMVEAGGTSATWELYQDGTPKVDEDVLAGGLEAAKAWIREMIELQQQMIDAVGPVTKIEVPLAVDYTDEILDAVRDGALDRIAAVQTIADKTERQAAESTLAAEIAAEMEARFGDDPAVARQVKGAVRSVTKEVVRKRIVTEGIRIDGRSTDQLRPLMSRVGVIPTAHGSGLFQRGDTQVLNFTTLGIGRSDMLIDDLSPTEKKRYFHHYNFPPFCTGETGFMRGPKRREIGHGALAERAVFPVVPGFEDWPYTVRTVSEVMASNGSSSMASVCGSTLSLMDAGVPIKAPVAGVAMGLVHADGAWVTLTDILGAEDAFGDMDFKVAGTTDFITALQLDTKIAGIPASVLADALRQARTARLDILDVMAETIIEPRPEVRETAPKVTSFEIPVEKIGEVIGPKGKVINAIQSETGADISVDDDGAVGIVAIASTDRGRGAGGRAADKAHPGSPHSRRRRHLSGAGGEHHQVRGVREHPARSRRPGTHLQAGRRQAHRQGRGCARARRGDRSGRRGTSTPTGRSRSFPSRMTPTEAKRLPLGAGRCPGPAPTAERTEASPVVLRATDRGGMQVGPTAMGASVATATAAGPSRGDRRQGEPTADGGEQRREDRSGSRSRPPAPVSSAKGVSFEDSFDLELEREFGELGPDPRVRRGGRRGGRGPR